MSRSAHVADSREQDRIERGRLLEEQAALRRVATLVARGTSSADVFAAVADEVAQVLHLRNAAVCRYDDDGATMTVLAVGGDRPDSFAAGSRWPLDGPSMSAEVLRTGRPARVQDYAGLTGSLAAEANEHRLNRVAGAPIIVDGRVWGVISTSSQDAPLPDDLEDRLAGFTELVATAIANSQTREDFARLAEEQAALRRVATVVAHGASPAEVFEVVSVEVARLLPADGSALTRFETDGTVTALGGWTSSGGYVYVGRRFAVEGTVSGRVFETGRPERIDSYADAPGSAPEAAREMGWRSSVGAPIMVDGRLWGVLAVISMTERPLPPDTEGRLAEFTDLVASAIANTESREELAGLAEEQAALRRVATLVAEGAAPAEVFKAVGAEVCRLIPADAAGLIRYETDGTFTPLGGWTRSGGDQIRIGKRVTRVRGTAAWSIFETHRPARIDSYAGVPGGGTDNPYTVGLRSTVGVPIIVEGHLWGMMGASAMTDRTLPPDAEARLVKFTELVATAIANAESRAELDASRARIVATADATRRRIERDLHDGAQQQLVSLALELRSAQAAVPAELSQHRAELSRVIEGLTGVLDGLREIARGIHPAILAENGLGPALKTLARRSPIPVELNVRSERRLPEPVEVAAHYVVSEALTNAAKHASASSVHIGVDVQGRVLRVAVRDDGIGGAHPARGSGLLGLKDRVEAIGGTIVLESHPGAGTSLAAELPLDGPTATP
jgi:signal transduction histidine kinase